MTGVQVLVLTMTVVNVVTAVICADPMTWRTHRWWPQIRVMICGMVACACGGLGWAGVDLEFALCAQFVVAAVLLHDAERHATVPAQAWRESKLQVRQVDQ